MKSYYSGNLHGCFMHHSAHPTSAYPWAFPYTRHFELRHWLLRMSFLPKSCGMAYLLVFRYNVCQWNSGKKFLFNCLVTAISVYPRALSRLLRSQYSFHDRFRFSVFAGVWMPIHDYKALSHSPCDPTLLYQVRVTLRQDAMGLQFPRPFLLWSVLRVI